MMEQYRTLVIFQDNFMKEPRMKKNLINVPRQGDEVIIKHNVFRVIRVRTKYHQESTRPMSLVDMERIGSTGEDGW